MEFSADFGGRKRTDFCRIPDIEEETLAGLATLAGPDAEKKKSDPMPWDDYLIPWANGRAPAFAKPVVWDELTNEALSVSRKWGRRALDAGWTSVDLFGCWKRPQHRRSDCNGLVAGIVGLLTPVRITAVTPEYAELQDHRGTILRHYRFEKPDAVHLWEAYTMRTGP